MGNLTGANPTDRGKAGSKLHVAREAGGLPLSVVVSAANANDSTMPGLMGHSATTVKKISPS
jgi:hypothetical protein